MKNHIFKLILLSMLSFSAALSVHAQAPYTPPDRPQAPPPDRAQATSTASDRVAELRAQMDQLQSKQEELQTRLKQLDEAIKPENIEHSLVGVGSTRPEELREQRRRQLEIQKTNIQTQLDQLAANRTRLEATLAQAETNAYHQSARGTTVGSPATVQPTTSSASGEPAPVKKKKIKKAKKKRRY